MCWFLIDLLLEERGDNSGSAIGGDDSGSSISGVDRWRHIRGGVNGWSSCIGGVGTRNGSRVDGRSGSIGQGRCSGSVGGNGRHNMGLGHGDEESQANEELQEAIGNRP